MAGCWKREKDRKGDLGVQGEVNARRALDEGDKKATHKVYSST